MELAQPITLTEVSTLPHCISCLPGSAVNRLTEKSGGYQNWKKIHPAKVKEAGAAARELCALITEAAKKPSTKT